MIEACIFILIGIIVGNCFVDIIRLVCGDKPDVFSVFLRQFSIIILMGLVLYKFTS